MRSTPNLPTMKQQSNSLAMIKPDTRNFISWLMGRMAIGFGICFIVALIIYIGLVVLLYISVSGQGVSITQAAGFPVKAEQAFRGFLPLMLAISLAPLVVRLLVDAINPFRRVGKILGRSALVIGLGLGGIMLPDGLRFIRGVDGEGLPVTLRESNPQNAAWFAPDGTPVLYFSVEDDGTMRFWNRPGVTPDSGLPSRAVDREVRKTWQQQEEAVAAKRAREGGSDAEASRTQKPTVHGRPTRPQRSASRPAFAKSYTLAMKDMDGIRSGRARVYRLVSQSASEVVLETRESGGLFGPNYEGRIRFNPDTLRGTWMGKWGANAQGGEIQLEHTAHGMTFQLWYQIGAASQTPYAFGDLIR